MKGNYWKCDRNGYGWKWVEIDENGMKNIEYG